MNVVTFCDLRNVGSDTGYAALYSRRWKHSYSHKIAREYDEGDQNSDYKQDKSDFVVPIERHD
jgi:hypothetical protein